MTTAFRPVNNRLSAIESPKEETTTSPMTPGPSAASSQTSRPLEDAATPTRAGFGTSALASQRPLPTSPFPESVLVPESAVTANAPKRDNSQHSRRSKESDDMDVDEDPEGHAAEEGPGSDDDSVNADGTKSKKKKSQRFYCTDFPPCNLSFTRGEHLARHVRKHTGERPFECHCGRRFSRLDNLRQHAQTVHVNEEIPVDSLAATGTRFQRQIRTDRMRQPGRARASTAGSVGPGGRGHAKSLSTSSIASVGSIASAYSVNEPRRRPPRLIMADARPRLSLEPYRDGDGRYYRAPSPGDFSTPTSATFSTGQNSPRWSAVMSPGASHSRSHSMYAGSRTPVRRLSVPSGGNPFQSPHGPNPRGSFFGAPMLNSSNSGAFSPSQASLSTSPTITPAYGWTRRESTSSAADEAWRRRTWHPDTRDYSGSSRLSQVITPHQFPPITPPQIPPDTVTLPAANPGNQPPQPLRLPGIESFDEISRRPPSPLRGNPSAMMVDPDASRPRLLPGGDLGSDDRRALPAQWDSSLHRGLTKLDLGTPPRDGAKAWENEGAGQALLARADQALVAPAQPIVRFEPDIQSAEAAPVPMAATGNTGVFNARHQHTMSAPSISAARASKRHGWYCGPVAGGTIHEGRPHVDRIVHPNISEFQGFPAREQPPVIHQQTMPNPESSTEPRTERIDLTPPSNGNPESLRRLEALVAVATSEGSVAAAY